MYFSGWFMLSFYVCRWYWCRSIKRGTTGLEAAALEEAIQDSISSHMDYTRRMSVNNLQELKGKISLTIVKEDCIIFMFLLVAVQQHNVIYTVVGATKSEVN
jgi:cobalamin biosynthesis protein CbiD